MNIFDNALKVITENGPAIGMVAGVLFAVAKVASNQKAGAVVSKIQAGVDVAAKAVSSLGSLLKAVSDILANAIKSDGFLGKK